MFTLLICVYLIYGQPWSWTPPIEESPATPVQNKVRTRIGELRKRYWAWLRKFLEDFSHASYP